MWVSFLCLVALATSSLAANFACPKPNGVFPDTKLACSLFYYKCSYGQAVKTACNTGKVFDARTLTCLDIRLVPGCMPTTPQRDITTAPYTPPAYQKPQRDTPTPARPYNQPAYSTPKPVTPQRDTPKNPPYQQPYRAVPQRDTPTVPPYTTPSYKTPQRDVTTRPAYAPVYTTTTPQRNPPTTPYSKPYAPVYTTTTPQRDTPTTKPYYAPVYTTTTPQRDTPTTTPYYAPVYTTTTPQRDTPTTTPYYAPVYTTTTPQRDTPTTTPYYAPVYTTTTPQRDTPTTTPYYAPVYTTTTPQRDTPTTTPYYAPVYTTTTPQRDTPTTTPYYAPVYTTTTPQRDTPTTTPYYAPVYTTTTPQREDTTPAYYGGLPQRDIPELPRKPYKSSYGNQNPINSYLFDCSQQYDGDYPNPKEACSAIYYSCVGGAATERNCVASTRYSVESNMCDYPEYVPACGGQPTMPTLSTQAEPELPGLLDCTNLKTGNYEHPTEKCSSTYVSCVGGKSITRQCAAALKYDVQSDSCDHKRYVPACGGYPTTTIPTVPTPTLPPAFDCTDKDDKNYPDPVNKCSATFYSCVGGITQVLSCYGATRYDWQLDRCDFPNHVPDCGGFHTEPPITTTTIEPAGPKFDCSNREMGNHADDKCPKWYFACSGAPFGIKMDCPAGTFFDREMNECGFFDNIPDCSGKPRTTTPQADVSPVTPAYPYDCPAAGNFPDPQEACSHQFVSCDGSFGRAQLRNCPGQLYYDKITDACLTFMENPACNPNPKAPSYQKPVIIPQRNPIDAPYQKPGYSNPIIPQRNPIDIPSHFNCPTANGIFAPLGDDNCPLFGWQCTYGSATRIPCPTGHVFSKLTSKCRPASEVSGCQPQSDSTPY